MSIINQFVVPMLLDTNLSYQQGRVFHHAACAAAGPEATAFTGEGHQPLAVAALATDSQETMLQATTSEVVGELALYIIAKRSAFGIQMREKRWVMLLHNPVEQRGLLSESDFVK